MDSYFKGVRCSMESMNLKIRSLDTHIRRANIGAPKKVAFLHGFTGSTKTWEEVITYLPNSVEILAIDLIGHGETASPVDPARYYVEQQIEDLNELFLQLNWTDFALVGYSMGGRLALAYAEKYSVSQLILESSSPGLEDEEARAERKKADEVIANKLIVEDHESFVDFWESIALFDSQKSLSAEKCQFIRNERLAQSKIGLSNSLIGFSTGVQFSYWGKLAQLDLPILLLTGELDKKFCEIAKQMQKNLPNAEWIEVKDAGHAIHVEKPEIFATIIKEVIIEEDSQ
jgi:2-succinyl-6-hydroxy-2,4-cyclohexadiene-1-carboxylate synthase